MSLKPGHLLIAAFCCFLFVMSMIPPKYNVIIHDKLKIDGLCIVSFQLDGKNMSAIKTYHTYSVKIGDSVTNYLSDETFAKKKEIDNICD